MNKHLQIIAALMLAVMMLAFSGCSKVDKNYGVTSEESTTDQKQNIKIPEIKSSDTVMPTFFDISLYDEENYADIYLGKDYEYKITYSGSELTLPITFKQITKKGWAIEETEKYSEDSTVLAGEKKEIRLVNEYKNVLNAVFFNDSKSSTSLKKCDIVTLKIPENILNIKDSSYGQFWINGVSNESVMTDIIDYLGAPSHFYAVSPTIYYLDYFLTSSDKRSGITIYVDPVNDTVNSIEVSYY